MSVAPKHPGNWVERRLLLDVRDPTPFEDAENFWRAAAQAATMVMCLLMLGVLLYVARPLLLPVLCAFVVGMTLGPILGPLTRAGIPSWLTALVIVLALLALGNLAIVMLAQPISDLIARAPEIGVAFKDKLHILDGPIMAFYELQNALGLGYGSSGAKFDISPARVIESVVTVVTPAAVQFLLQLILFLGTLFFFILGRAGFRNSAVNWFSSRDARLRALKILNDVEDNLSSYLIVVTIINLALGTVTMILAYLLGLPSPLLWGALAFGLNYIPYIGPGIMYALLFVVGLLTYPTLLGALLPPGAFMLVTLIEGQFLTPAIIGRQVLSVHPLAIFLGIAFWAWLWGPLGAFLATPILIITRVAFDHLYPRHKAELPG